MKLEVGMYVRTEHGEFTKIESFYIRHEEAQEYVISFSNGSRWRGYLEDLKASFDIIDLIEVGDVGELFMEDDIDKEDTNIFEIIAITTDKKEIGVLGKDLELEFIPIENIRKICTKEQFESMSYKVGE